MSTIDKRHINTSFDHIMQLEQRVLMLERRIEGLEKVVNNTLDHIERVQNNLLQPMVDKLEQLLMGRLLMGRK